MRILKVKLNKNGTTLVNRSIMLYKDKVDDLNINLIFEDGEFSDDTEYTKKIIFGKEGECVTGNTVNGSLIIEEKDIPLGFVFIEVLVYEKDNNSTLVKKWLTDSIFVREYKEFPVAPWPSFNEELKDKLDGIEDGAQVNVQSDWEQTDNTKDDFIKNKPEISGASQTIINKTGSITLNDLSYAGALIVLGISSGGGGGATITIPVNSIYEVGTKIDFFRKGNIGSVNLTFTPASGVSLRSKANGLNTSNSAATLIKIGSNEWLLVGDLE